MQHKSNPYTIFNKDQVVEDVCTLPVSKGPCRNFAPSFYFNGRSGKCEYFIYGGCGGNGNRFESLKDCETRCNTEALLGKGQIYKKKSWKRVPIGSIFMFESKLLKKL